MATSKTTQALTIIQCRPQGMIPRALKIPSRCRTNRKHGRENLVAPWSCNFLFGHTDAQSTSPGLTCTELHHKSSGTKPHEQQDHPIQTDRQATSRPGFGKEIIRIILPNHGSQSSTHQWDVSEAHPVLWARMPATCRTQGMKVEASLPNNPLSSHC